ncbi:MAG: hypothetical protein RBR97_14800, partial [Bacteroidales bacterium]|nr:hypothetical protein [Bacteroidales bacterium]
MAIILIWHKIGIKHKSTLQIVESQGKRILFQTLLLEKIVYVPSTLRRCSVLASSGHRLWTNCLECDRFLLMLKPSYVCKIEFNDFYLQIKGMTMGKRICPRQQVFYCMPTVRK